MCLAEKTVTAFDAERSVLCSPVCSGLIAEYERYLGIFVESKRASAAAWEPQIVAADAYDSERIRGIPQGSP